MLKIIVNIFVNVGTDLVKIPNLIIGYVVTKAKCVWSCLKG